MNIRRLAIANRGEVAVRIILACQELGIETVLLHSDVDSGTKAYRMADKRVCIGPAATASSYLNISANVQGALAGGVDALHPGFGFLSENPDFAEAVEKAGIAFVGPSAAAMRKLGDKVSCKELANKLRLPLVPGYQGEFQDVAALIAAAEQIGYPVIVKAAAGGGGRGMKILRSREEAKELIESAQREALSAFGSAKVFLEKYLERAKHIEFQIFGDATGRVVHLYDRECSVQRRHQKIIEEAISPSLTPELRRKMGEVACLLAESAGYQGAGTVEFLLQDEEFFLLEVNTRLQVEHPVTELVMGVDLVKAQILTTAKKASLFERSGMVPRGHAIECRIYAENPYEGGIPSTGKLGRVYFPEGPGRRFEVGFEAGDEITPFYDPMIAKAIVWDETRTRAIQKMLRVLSDAIILGVHTNIPLLREILMHADFVSGEMTTRFMEQHFSEALPQPELLAWEKEMVEQIYRKTPKSEKATGGASANPAENPFMATWRTS